ncbi:MAG: hypothetical protein IPL79_00715 [Myxococcales bacterium]|nr:hypothetical protein [Myxococcales bacterium]
MSPRRFTKLAPIAAWALFAAGSPVAAASPGSEFAKSCQTTASPSRAFAFCSVPEDAPLIAVAGEFLDAMERDMARTLGGTVVGVTVEIAPSLEVFAERTGVPAAQLTASQTVGIAHGDTIFLLSPRVTVAGFRWLDTLGHELAHLHLAQLAGARVPVWLQEGLARYYESLWRAPPGGHLRAAEKVALADAIARDDLQQIETFASFAAIGDADQAQLAYAQALSYLQFFAHQKGDAAVRHLIAQLAAGASVEAALAKAFAVTPAWRRAWKVRAGAATARHRARPLSPSAQAFARLAAMLRAQGHLEAAAIELQKALADVGQPEPTLMIALARTTMELGDARGAVRLLAPMRDHFDDDASLAPTLGLAAWRAGDLPLARLSMETALGVNPFDPNVRCTLAEIYAAAKHPSAPRERTACAFLRQVRR